MSEKNRSLDNQDDDYMGDTEPFDTLSTLGDEPEDDVAAIKEASEERQKERERLEKVRSTTVGDEDLREFEEGMPPGIIGKFDKTKPLDPEMEEKLDQFDSTVNQKIEELTKKDPISRIRRYLRNRKHRNDLDNL